MKFFKIFVVIFIIFILSINININIYAVGIETIFGRKTGITVLIYHRISENPEEINAYCITPQMFESDIKYLSEKHYKFAYASELNEIIKTPSDDKYVVITFDDGYESDFIYALPILKKYSAKATFFLISSMIGEKYYLSVENVHSLCESQVAEIGLHSHEMHCKNNDEINRLFKFNSAYIAEDFKKGCDVIEKITNVCPTALSYPNGIWNRQVDNILRKNGFQVTFSSDEGKNVYSEMPFKRVNRSNDRTIEFCLAKQ